MRSKSPPLGVQLSPPYETRSKLCVFDLTAMICKEEERRLAPAMHTDEYFARCTSL